MSSRRTRSVLCMLFSLFLLIHTSGSHAALTELLIMPDDPSPMVDGVELGIGRNDGKIRLYATRYEYGSLWHEFTFSDGQWVVEDYSTAPSYCLSPVVADLTDDGLNALIMGGSTNSGVWIIPYDNGWQSPEAISGTVGNGQILCLQAAAGRNDGETRLYVSYKAEAGLAEYSWNGAGFEEVQLLSGELGRFSAGVGRNDGVVRIYAIPRYGNTVHELTWEGTGFRDEIIFTSDYTSKGCVHVGDGRGDGVNRLYVWAYGLYELTYTNDAWESLTIEAEGAARYHLNSGRVHADNQSRLYVAMRGIGVAEYTWDSIDEEFDVDVVTGATGATVIGDGRNDGINRLYAGSGSKGYYQEAAVVELSDESVTCSCNDGDNDGYGDPACSYCPNPGLDCNDSNPNVHPGAEEKCSNGIDDDCEGGIDCADSDCSGSYSCTANSTAGSYGPGSLVGSGVVNSLLPFLVPLSACILMMILRRKK